MIRNQAGQTVSFQAVNITTGAPVTTGTPVVYITIGGVQAPSTNTAAHAGNGEWELDLTAAETNGASVAFTFTLTNAINQTLNAYPVTLADYQADVSGLSTFDASTDTVTTDTASRDASKADVSGLSTFDPDTDTVANVTTVATCTTNTDMRGTDSAFLATSAPANFSSLGINVSGHVSRVTLVDTTTTNSDMRGTDGANTVAPDNTSIAAILVDTNDLQTNQGNWLTADLTGVQTTVDDTNADLESFISDTATNFNSLDSKITTVDGVVDAILVDTDELQSKLIPMLEADGSGGFQYTALALENAPSGGGGPGGPGDATEAKQDQIIATLAGIEGTGFDTLTDSLEAIRDRGDAAWLTGGGGGGIWQLTVTVTDTSANAVQGARISVDGTALVVTTDTNGEAVLNLNDGSYTINCSSPSGFDDPTAQAVTISGADDTLSFSVSPTSGSGSCEIPPL